MPKPTDVRPVAAALYFLPIKTRMPLKFGPEITTEVTCARVRVTVADAPGPAGRGLGRDAALGAVGLAQRAGLRGAAPGAPEADRCRSPRRGSRRPARPGHPIELGDRFIEEFLPDLLDEFNDAERAGAEPVPWLAALVCASAFDLALHDAYGMLHGVPTYETYNARFMNVDLDDYLEPAEGTERLVRRPLSRGVPGPPPARDHPGLAPGRRQGPDRPVGADRRRSRTTAIRSCSATGFAATG